MSSQPDPDVPSSTPSSTASPDAEQPPTAWPWIRLFVIPMGIVIFFVFIWLQLRSASQVSDDPKELVRGLQHASKESWRNAYALSCLLRAPEHAALKDDADLCQALAAVLSTELRDGGNRVARVRLRVFLCRALGEFRVADGLPELIQAASRRKGGAMDVRYAALEAIAVLADTTDARSVRDDPRAMQVLLEASRESSADRADGLRSTAAFVLGVLGGPEATERLVQMLDDGHANTRYNAATGLARWGNTKAIPVLLEMLDPDGPAMVEGETTQEARQLKRAMVVVNGIRASVQLTARNPRADVHKLVAAIELLGQRHDLSARVRSGANQAALKMKHR